MSNLIIISGNHLPHGKDCADWVPLKDGTLIGDPKYCNRSDECIQLGMISHFYEVYDQKGTLVEIKYYCTGMYPVDQDELRHHDDEVS